MILVSLSILLLIRRQLYYSSFFISLQQQQPANRACFCQRRQPLMSQSACASNLTKWACPIVCSPPRARSFAPSTCASPQAPQASHSLRLHSCCCCCSLSRRRPLDCSVSRNASHHFVRPRRLQAAGARDAATFRPPATDTFAARRRRRRHLVPTAAARSLRVRAVWGRVHCLRCDWRRRRTFLLRRSVRTK